MKKRFITNLALLILLNLLIKPFWFFGVEVGVQNRVGEEDEIWGWRETTQIKKSKRSEYF